MRADLHIHSEKSFDASISTEDIIRMAKEKDIDYISFTDHNTTKAYTEEFEGINVIKGVEIDCYFNDDIVHLLGYGIDENNERYNELEDHYYRELTRIAYKRLKLIEDHYGFKLDVEKIRDLSDNEFFTNVEITRVMLDDIEDERLVEYQTGSKSFNPIASFYWENLSIGNWGYTAMDLPDYREIIELIHNDGGVCICAHPLINIDMDEEKINELIESGVDGFEVYCSYHDEEVSGFYRRICDENNLLYTCGSDFHGPTKPNISLYDHGFDGDCSEMVNGILERIGK